MAYNEIRTINNIQLEDIKARQSIKDLDNKKANKSDIVNGLNFKGTTTYSALPTSNNNIGDFYYVTDGDGIDGEGNYAWNGAAWYFSGKTTDFGDISTKANAAVNNAAFEEGKLKVTKNDGASTETEVIDSSLTKSGKAADAKITGDAVSQLKEDLVTDIGGLSEKTYVVKMSYEKGYINGDNGNLGINNINYRTTNIINLSPGDILIVNISKGRAVPHTYKDGIWQKYYTSFSAFCSDGFGTLTATSTQWTINITKNCDIRIVVSLLDNSEISNISQIADIVVITKLYNYKRLDKIEDDLEKNNYWEGKKIVWFGTSIPAGVVRAGDDNGVNSYPIQVGDMLGAKVYNESVGSSAIRIGHHSFISGDDSNGYSGTPATCCLFSLSGTVEEKKDIISNWSSWKNKFKYGVDEIDNIINSGTVQSRIFDRSYEVKLSKYLDGGEVGSCDLYVIDHGYNDAGNKNGVDYSDLTKVPSDSLDRTYFIGAMNYIINKIKTDNFRASICIISHYNDEGVFKGLVEAQRYVADYWNIPFIEIFNKLGFSTTAKITINGESKTLKDWWLPDGIHPSSDTTGAALKHYANALYPLIRDIR